MSSLAGSSGGSFLDPLVLFDVAVLGVPAAFDPATSVSPDAAALLRVRMYVCMYACMYGSLLLVVQGP
jgi:hypothetical protein